MIPLGKEAQDFKKTREKYRGNFDDHISTSIPGFDEVQSIVGSAIVKAYPNGARVLDVGTSEGALIKALAEKSGGKIKSVRIDPSPAMEATASYVWSSPQGNHYIEYNPNRMAGMAVREFGVGSAAPARWSAAGSGNADMTQIPP